MPLKQLVIASHNAGKVAEIREMLTRLGIQVSSATEKNVPEPEETESTFEGNAKLKAEHVSKITGLPSLADDSGLSIDALDGAPGIYSARWANGDYPAAFENIRAALADKAVDTQKLDAHFTCVLALASPGKKTQTFTDRVDGKLTFPPRGKGFGYDPIFIPQGYDITFGEMDKEEKNRISHRARAFAKFLTLLKATA